ncbi:MAG: helix-hairpin-helix domain-containing protein [Oscillospiraceae bacterium]|nr:helix-hairpin-helix domain-containing protein [Oscillospiraceae bacterium]
MENLNRTQKIILVSVVSFMLLVIGYYIMQRNRTTDALIMDFTSDNTESSTLVATAEVDTPMIVHITGEIRYSGIINLVEGNRIADAIEMAGGTTASADLTHVNLAFILSDGQRVYIPSIYDEVGMEDIVTESNGENIVVGGNTERGSLININNATQTELETLTGVGPSTALRIIEHRQTNGNFRSIEDLKNVSRYR